MSHQVTRARYRFANTPDEIPPGRAVAVLDEDGWVTLVVRPGHATQGLLDDIDRQQRPGNELGQWLRLPPDEPPVPGDQRLAEACWTFAEPGALPDALRCVPLEAEGRHTLFLRPGAASKQLAAEMTDLLMAMVRAGVWVQRWIVAVK
ncbi:hypothetical protein [Streptomyces jumonjinensis]|uniref:hypothetical protein n=1 Tax=Streptomyces jumonjinensis TaxID=1945 RepID=UPI0038998CB6